MKKAILYTLVFVLIQVVVGLLVEKGWGVLFGRTLASDASMLITTMVASSVLTLVAFLGFGWCQVSRSYVQSRPWATLFWCAVASVGAVIPSMWVQEQMPELPNVVEQEFDLILRNRWGYFAVGLLAPVCEELVFRGAVLRGLLEWLLPQAGRDALIANRATARWMAIGLSAVFFMLVHGNPAQMPHAFAVGLLLGWMYCRTGSVVPGVVYHWVNNSVAYVAYNLYPDSSLRLADVFGSQRGVGAALLFSCFILLPAIYQLYLRMHPAKTYL